MSVHYTPEEFMALAVGEMWAYKAQRMRRHLAHCAACRAEWEATTQLLAGAKELRNENASEALREQIYARMQMPATNTPLPDHVSHPVPQQAEKASFEENKEKADMQTTSTLHSSPSSVRTGARRTPLLSLRAWAAVAAVVAFTALYLLLPGLHPNGHQTEGIAFASVRQAMQKAKYVRFWAKQTSSPGFVEQNSLLATAPLEVTVRIKPYTVAYSEPDGTRHLHTTTGETIYHPKTKTVEQDPNSPSDLHLLDVLFAPETPDTSKDADQAWKSERVTENGVEAIRFHKTEETEIDAKEGLKFTTELTVWVSPKTHLVAHSEVKMTPIQQGKELGWIKIEMGRFRYGSSDASFAPVFDLPESAPPANRKQ
ncbi:MAG TPA: hypothetical protein VKU00_28890 [Chthonomonadaceae bacterium]|nr:hypothetical protein [Chthonomonadaceae bacterium]